MQHAIRVAALFCLLALTAIFPANAQSAAIVTTCGAQSLGHAVFGSSGLYIDQTGNLCVAASVSASITGFPGTTQTTGTPISVTTGGVTGALPSGSVVVASNVGSTNGAYCKLGASATTSDQLISPNSWFAFTVGSNTQLTCITSTSTTTVNMVGGSGLPTGAGGGGGGGGSSGAVFGPTAVGSAAANPPVLIAGTANAGATGNVQVAKVSASGLVSVDGSAVTQPVSAASLPLPTGASTAANQATEITSLGTIATNSGTQATAANQATGNASLATIATNSGSSIPAGSALIGKVGIDQTTPGTTNGTQDASTGATGATAPTKASENGGIAQSSEPAAATTGNLTGALYDLAGKQVTSPYANRENQLRCAVTLTASTAATTCTGMGAQGASVKIYITDLTCTRSDAGTASATMTLDDTATTIIDMPNNGGGGGFSKTYNTPLVVAANTAFTVQSGTSLTSVHCSATGFKGY